MTSPRIATLMAVIATGASATAGGPEVPSNEVIVVRMCEVDYERAALLGSSTSGLMGEILVKPGDPVARGQILGRLQDGDARAELEVRVAEADSEIVIRQNEVRLSLAKSKLRRSDSLSRQRYLSTEDLEHARLEVDMTVLDLEAAKFRRKLAILQKAQVEVGLKAREIVSPFDGEVVAQFKQPGESVALTDPILRVVDHRTMKVTGHLDVVDASRLVKGRRALVFPEIRGVELPIEQKSFEGRVILVDSQIHRETQTCKVVVLVPNPLGLLRAGLEARIEIQPEDRPPPPPVPTAGGSKSGAAKTASR